MTVSVSPFGPKPQFLLASGLPAVGGQLFFYVGGSVNTKQNTYTDSTGGVANTNPIVLNSLGEPTTEIWFTDGVLYKVVYAPAGDTDPPSSPIWTVDNLEGQGSGGGSGTADQWVLFAGAPTFIGATSFSVVGDQTSTFHIGRRIKTQNTAGTIYSYISNSVFGAVTTVTVVNDSGTLDSGLSAVSYGLLSSINPSIPVLRGVRALTTLGVGDTAPSASGSGISFPATQAPSTDVNTMDDYVELNGTTTVALSGCTTAPSVTINATKIGNTVILEYSDATATSNSASKGFTAIPAYLRPASVKRCPAETQDNGGAYVYSVMRLNTDGTLTIFNGPNAGTFTASGTFSIAKFQICYTLN